MWPKGLGFLAQYLCHRNSESGDCVLMKIETVLQGSTFTTIIADATDIPPPMMIENYTELSLKYRQTDIGHEDFKTIVKPRSSGEIIS